MFSPNTDTIVSFLASEEYRNAVELWGTDYDSETTAHEVLAEEVDEVLAEIRMITDNPADAYQNIRYCRNAIKELAQVMAVSMKISNSGFFQSL